MTSNRQQQAWQSEQVTLGEDTFLTLMAMQIINERNQAFYHKLAILEFSLNRAWEVDP
jgi:hypothetical protein